MLGEQFSMGTLVRKFDSRLSLAALLGRSFVLILVLLRRGLVLLFVLLLGQSLALSQFRFSLHPQLTTSIKANGVHLLVEGVRLDSPEYIEGKRLVLSRH